MKSWKKIISVLFALLLLLSCAGCRKKEEGPSYPDRDVDLPTALPSLGEDSVAIHYERDDNSYSNWTLWLWDPEGTDDNAEDDFNYQDDYGVIALYPLSRFGALSGGKLGFIVKTKGSWTKDTEADRFIVFSELKKDENDIYHVYLSKGDTHIYTDPEKTISDVISLVRFMNERQVYLEASNPLELVKIYKDGALIKEENGAGRSKFSVSLDEDADLSGAYSLEVVFRGSGTQLSADISSTGLYSSDMFNELYYYDGELGAIYSPSETTFRVWSPISEKIELRIYENGTPVSVSKEKGSDEHVTCEMNKGDKGVFEYVLKQDAGGLYYTYVVYNSNHPEGKEIVDPYAYSAGVNGLRGMVVDFSRTDPEGWKSVRYLDYDRKQLTVYETHVADVTSSDTWTGSAENKRKYLGLIEAGTTYSENGVTVSTGFDHIRELGVNAVQFQPIYDQDNDETSYTFNWGYNPLNYNVLEGLYSSDPYDGYARIREFKQVVEALNKEGITVIMDVVYNHVSSAIGSSFDVLMPEYYFRYKTDGSLSNGSGCGNETASENPMMRKFIIDSVCFWLKEYRLGGFRFDLMGLHDIETMNEVASAAKAINPDVVIYGEPWTGGATTLNGDLQAKQENAKKFVGYGQFNDKMRDALIKGGLSDKSERGWITGTSGDLAAIENGINGLTYLLTGPIEDPDRTVNYVTCHDNYTLYDRIKAAGIDDEDTVKKMAMLANSVIFTSNSTSFFLAGEEMLRTKQGDSNSYMSSDEINQLDYSLKVKNIDMFENYQKLIAFKKSVDQLCSSDAQIDVHFEDGGAVIWYELRDGKSEYLVVHRNGKDSAYSVDASGYSSICLDTLGILNEPLSSFVPEPYQTVILKK